MSNYNIVISKLAHLTIKENIKFLKKFSIPYALKTEYYIRKSIISLKSFPHFNPIYKTTSICVYRKIVVKKRYSIIYTAIKDTIYIFYVHDGRQAHDKFFKSLN